MINEGVIFQFVRKVRQIVFFFALVSCLHLLFAGAIIRIHDYWLLCFDCAVSLRIGNVMGDSQNFHRVDVTVAAVSDAIGTSGLVVELSVRADSISVVIGTFN